MTRKRSRLLALAAATAGLLVPVSVPAVAATAGQPDAAGATSVRAPLDWAAYYWREQSRPVPVAGVAPPSLDDAAVPPGDVAVSAVGDGSGQPEKEAYLRLDTSALATSASVTSATLTVPLESDPHAGQVYDATASPSIIACAVAGGFPDSNTALSFEGKPKDDCSVKSLGRLDVARSAYVFDITALVTRWTSRGLNTGIALLPADPAAVPPFHVVFGPRKSISAVIKLIALPGASGIGAGVVPPPTPVAAAAPPVADLAPAPAQLPSGSMTAPVVAAPQSAPLLASRTTTRLAPAAYAVRSGWGMLLCAGLLVGMLMVTCSVVVAAPRRPRVTAG